MEREERKVKERKREEREIDGIKGRGKAREEVGSVNEVGGGSKDMKG